MSDVDWRKVARALNTVSLAIGELAEALDTPEAGAVTAGSALPPIAEQTAEELGYEPGYYEESLPARQEPTGDQGSEAVCPAHHKPYVEGRYGAYCPSKGTDPAWTNKRGYCTVNPKNAATWLRIHAAAA